MARWADADEPHAALHAVAILASPEGPALADTSDMDVVYEELRSSPVPEGQRWHVREVVEVQAQQVAILADPEGPALVVDESVPASPTWLRSSLVPKDRRWVTG